MSSDSRLYTVRPFSKPARTDLKDVFRIYLSPSALLGKRLRSGDACFLQTEGGSSVPVIAWTAPEKIQDSVVQTSKALQEMYGLKLGDRISLRSQDEPLVNVQTVQMTEISRDEMQGHFISLKIVEQEHWMWFLEYPLSKAEIISVGMTFESIELKGQKRSFQITQINDSQSSDNLYRFVSSSNIRFSDGPTSSTDALGAVHRSLKITQDGIGGLSRQLEQLNQRLEAYSDALESLEFPSYYRPRRGGILLYGPPGTGKSLLLRKIANAGWRKVYHIDTDIVMQRDSRSDAALTKIFTDARNRQPSVIIIDRLEVVAGKSRDYEGLPYANFATRLCEELDNFDNNKTLFLAATTDLSHVDEILRRPGRFEFQIEIPIPDSTARGKILKILSDLPTDETNKVLESIGDRTHGFVGADLYKLVQLAVDKAKTRTLASLPKGHDKKDAVNGSTKPSYRNQSEDKICISVTEADLSNALLEVRPTAMQEVFLETPKVRWSDIGGQWEIKKALKQAIEWPFKYPTLMTRYGIDPKKGLLLYGPPGCSKTLTAKAVATEASLNFIAVKGAEVLSMYVGESERAVRDIFRKARAAAPSIIFFDEIDAIGASRDGSGSSGAGQHSGLNVLTTLLNELDGIEVLKGVFVLAATNKPEVLDPALMRPGRLDTILYVGPPDREARVEIVRIRIAKMDVDEGEVGVEWLAEQMEGYSGAEIVSVCQRAGYAALEEMEEKGGEGERVGKRHFERALGGVRRGITKEMKEVYEAWGRGVGR